MMNAYDYPYPQPVAPNYFNANYMPPVSVQSPMQSMQSTAPDMRLVQVPDELTAMNAQFPMDGRPVYFVNANGGEIYSKQLSMVNGSVIFRRYRQVEDEKKAEPAYVTREEMDKRIGEIYQLLNAATAPTAEGGNTK